MSWHTRIRVGAVASGLLAAAAVVVLAPPTPAGAGTSGLGPNGSVAVHETSAVIHLSLRPMPHGVITFGRAWNRQLTVHADIYGLTPGSSHNVDLFIPGRLRAVRFSRLTANGVGQADSTLHSSFTGRMRTGSRLIVRMGTGSAGIAKNPIAETRRLRGAGCRRHRLIAVEVGRGGTSFGPLRGRSTISYSARRHTLTVAVDASGLTPGPHAAHIHLGSCMSQGPVLYMLKDLVANGRGQIRHAVRVFTKVSTPIPARGWYLNIHQGNSGNILRNGQPTIYFRPLLCANITSA
ncbi:MAG TPA: CHRD domain-containing protein [Streptosporangiaceae bacterium]|nr:CHRD domain-containing protein [Streptosporangiaceae bacterium]